MEEGEEEEQQQGCYVTAAATAKQSPVVLEVQGHTHTNTARWYILKRLYLKVVLFVFCQEVNRVCVGMFKCTNSYTTRYD